MKDNTTCSGRPSPRTARPWCRFLAGWTVLVALAWVPSTGCLAGPGEGEGQAAEALISGWSDADIGTVSVPGSATQSGALYVVAGAGSDIWGTADSFHFAWQPLNGDGTVIARVESVPYTHSWAKAGVMIRESTAAGARNAFMAMTASNGVTFQRRTTTGGLTSNVAIGKLSAPYWVRLVRAGNTFTGSVSADGATWRTVGTATIAMAPGALAGLAVTSHKASVLCAATFSSVAVTPASPGPTNQPPVARITASPSSGIAPLAVAFDGTASSDPDGTVASWSWAFGDGGTATGASASHTYQAAGTYVATLTVTDNQGATGTATVTLVATAPPPSPLPAPWVDADIGAVGSAGSASVSGDTFSVAGSGADIWNNADAFHFAWQPLAGDGSIVARVATQQNTNSWAKAGVMIRETTAAGSRHAFMALTPSNGAAFQRRTSTDGASSNTSVGSYVAPYWVRLSRAGNVFTGGISADGVSWTTVGSATVTMASSALAGLAVTSHSVGVLSTATFTDVTVSGVVPPPNQSPVASVAASPTSGPAPLTVTLSGAGSSDPDGTIVSWSWDFGDGSSGSGAQVSHVYAAAGSYTAVLTVTDNAGATASAQAGIVVNPPGNQPPLASFTAVPRTGKAPLSVSFDASASQDPDGAIVSWHWDFGDGVFADGVATSHVFAADGNYTVTLTVADNLGATASASQVVSVGGSFESLRRVGHRPLQIGGLVDVPRKPQMYYSVVAYDDGSVVALNTFDSPQLFQFDPVSATLKYKAIHQGQALGNEDDVRWRIRAHKGATAASSLFFWADESYQNIDDENAPVIRDTAVFSNRPVEATPGRLPPRQVRTCNFVDDPNTGPYRAGLDYDQSSGLLFVPIDRWANPTQDDILQVYRVNPSTGAMEARLQVWEPVPSDTREGFNFVRADPAHRVVLFSAGNSWQYNKDILYLAQYQPLSGSVSASVPNVQRTSNLVLAGSTDDRKRLSNAKDAAFVESGGRLYAILAGNVYDRALWDATTWSFGLYVFDLGPAAGPYALSQPVGKVPFAAPLEAVRVIDGHLVVSSRGLHVLSASAVVAVRGEQSVPREQVYPMPYPTYEFDTARVGGDNFLFLATAVSGIEIFQLTGNPTGAMSGAIRDTPRAVSLPLGGGRLRLETGGGLHSLGAPAVNDDGTLAVWAVTDNHREAILRQVKGQATQAVAIAGDAGWVSFSRPSINRNGDLAFWAGSATGSEAILLYAGGLLSAVVQTGATVKALSPPEIADDGTLVYQGWGADGRNRLFVRGSSGTITTVFTESSTETLDADYDISPDGQVVFNGVTWDAPDLLTLWNGSSLKTLFSTEQEHAFVRVRKGGNVTLRTWGGEIAKLYRVTTGGAATLIAVHRDTYGFGDFQYSAANSAGDVAFEAVRWLTDTSPPSEMGTWLHRYQAAVGDPRPVVTRPLAVVDGRTQIDLDFVDAFNDAGAIFFTLALQDAAGAIGQAVIGFADP